LSAADPVGHAVLRFDFTFVNPRNQFVIFGVAI